MHTLNELDSFKIIEQVYYIDTWLYYKLLTIGSTLGPLAAVISLSPLAVVACGLIAVGIIAAIWRYIYYCYVMLSQSHSFISCLSLQLLNRLKQKWKPSFWPSQASRNEYEWMNKWIMHDERMIRNAIQLVLEICYITRQQSTSTSQQKTCLLVSEEWLTWGLGACSFISKWKHWKDFLFWKNGIFKGRA